jgi:redox-sensitive bicupin YhaK (pirin superfamily)
MSNLEQRPDEAACPAREKTSPAPRTLEPREVPLGGPRAMTVRRTLPHKQIRTVGAWCFVDHYGPQSLQMSVPPHPHMGLQTVTWLLAGEVQHRDSLGSLQTIRPGEVNVMTAGRGIAHSEYSGGGLVHGVQLWVALTDAHRDVAPAFEHVGDLPTFESDGLRGTVFTGTLAGVASPAHAFSPLVGAEITLSGPAVLALEPDFEHAVLALDADVEVDGHRVEHTAAHYLGWGNSVVRLDTRPGGRVLLLGGEPLAEDLLMWWNFVGRSHDEIVNAREQWESGHPRFGRVLGDPNPRLPAPAMPTVALRPRPSRR